MSKVIPLRPLPKGISRTSAVNKSAVQLLEKYLRQARKGEIAGLALALVRPNGLTSTTWSATEQGPLVIGAIACLQYRYVQDQLEDDE